MTKRRTILAVVVVAIVAAAWCFYVVRNPERQTLDAAARAAAPGKFVALHDGVTHYVVDGPDDGRTIVLVHGFSVPAYIWDSTASFLARAGFRVVRYDEYGRGWSDRPDVEYTADLYDRQLGELLDSLRVSGPIDLAGVSMGGWVTATFAGRHPARVRSLVLVDPVAGTSPRTLGMASYPLIGSYLWQTLTVPTMAEGQASDFLHPERFPDWADRYRPQMRFKGFGHALLSTRRAEAGLPMDSVYRTVAAGGMPVMLLWGTSDHTVPFARSAGVRAAIPAAEFHGIDGAAHLPILEQAARTDSLFLQFLRAHG
ncbi:MAG TPA: alpha/beta hydrolase [Gemmatimonadaceae bacterium]|nr:alpha/beta hydrolase [Gemmatimonadaceae bacterium]